LIVKVASSLLLWFSPFALGKRNKWEIFTLSSEKQLPNWNQKLSKYNKDMSNSFKLGKN